METANSQLSCDPPAGITAESREPLVSFPAVLQAGDAGRRRKNTRHRAAAERLVAFDRGGVARSHVTWVRALSVTGATSSATSSGLGAIATTLNGDLALLYLLGFSCVFLLAIGREV